MITFRKITLLWIKIDTYLKYFMNFITPKHHSEHILFIVIILENQECIAHSKII